MKTKFKLFYVLSAVALTSILGLSTVANASGVNGADESNDKTKLSFGVISDVHTHVGLDWKGDPYTDY
jgi:hypothetical protein